MTLSPRRTPPGGHAYRLVSGPDDAAFCRRVSAWLAQGYVPYGDPLMVVCEGVVTVGQALVWPTVRDSR
jgi:hypothetical protein